MHDIHCPISSGDCPFQAGSESVSGAQERKSSPPDGCTAGVESAPLPSSPHHLQHLAHTHRSSHPRHRCSALHAACVAKPTANTTLQNTVILRMVGRGHHLHRCAQDGQLPNPGKLQCGSGAHHLSDLPQKRVRYSCLHCKRRSKSRGGHSRAKRRWRAFGRDAETRMTGVKGRSSG